MPRSASWKLCRDGLVWEMASPQAREAFMVISCSSFFQTSASTISGHNGVTHRLANYPCAVRQDRLLNLSECRDRLSHPRGKTAINQRKIQRGGLLANSDDDEARIGLNARLSKDDRNVLNILQVTRGNLFRPSSIVHIRETLSAARRIASSSFSFVSGSSTTS